MGVRKLRLAGITKVFIDDRGQHVQAVEGASFDVGEGEFVCLLGPSGCGKSTILRMVAGLERPTAGEIFLGAEPILGPGPERGMVFQEFALFPWRTVLGNIQFGLELRGMPGDRMRAVADSYLDLMGLKGFEHNYPHELSGGMKQRVAIVRALVMDPSVLLMDEPFAALDAQTREFLQEELLRLWQATGKTVLFVTHSVSEAVFLADRIIVMTPRPGSIKEEVTVPLLRPRRRTDYEHVKMVEKVAVLLKVERQ